MLLHCEQNLYLDIGLSHIFMIYVMHLPMADEIGLVPTWLMSRGTNQFLFTLIFIFNVVALSMTTNVAVQSSL